MIDILGIRQVLILSVLLAVNVLLFFIAYGSLAPEISKKEGQLKVVQGQVSAASDQLDQILNEFDQIAAQKNDYDKLVSIGFFAKQNRAEVQDLLKTIKETSGVSSAKASVARGDVNDHKDLENANYKLLKSPIRVSVSALDDLDVYNYIARMRQEFPGYIDIHSFNITRKQDVTREVLQAIIDEQKPEVVVAEIHASWNTLIPEEDVLELGRGR